MIVGGTELTPESSLKELKQACKHLGIGVTGSKQLLWQRLKKEVAENKLKTMVDVSKSIQKEFERDPSEADQSRYMSQRQKKRPYTSLRTCQKLIGAKVVLLQEAEKTTSRRQRRNMMDRY